MDGSSRCTGSSSMPKRSRPMTSRTPQRTPNGALNASNLKRPTFALGRISLGASSDSSDGSRSPSVRSPLDARVGHRIEGLVHFWGQRAAGRHAQPGCMPPPPPRAHSVARGVQARTAYHVSAPVLGASMGAVVDVNQPRNQYGDGDVRHGGRPAGGDHHVYGTSGSYQEHYHHHRQSLGRSTQVCNDPQRDSDGAHAKSSSGTPFFSAPSTTPPQSPTRSPTRSDGSFSSHGLKPTRKHFPAASRFSEGHLHHSPGARSSRSPLELNTPEVHQFTRSQPSGSLYRRGHFDYDDRENIEPGYMYSTARDSCPTPSGDAAAAGRQKYPSAYHEHSPKISEPVDHRRTPNISQGYLPMAGSSSSPPASTGSSSGTSSSLRAGIDHELGRSTAPAAAGYGRIEGSRTHADQSRRGGNFSSENNTPNAMAAVDNGPSTDDDDSNDETVFEDCCGKGLENGDDDADGGHGRDYSSDTSVSIEEIAPPTPARKNGKDNINSRSYVNDSDGGSKGSLVTDLTIPSDTRGRMTDAGGASGGRYGDGEDKAECVWRQAAPAAGGAGTSPRWELEAKRRTGRTFSVPAKLYDRMYAHQREGVRWLWKLHQGEMGGILGDDMGLGKTFQVTCFLTGIFSTDQAKCALVVAPKGVMLTWEAELKQWLVKAACRTAEVHVVRSEMSASARRSAILSAARGGVLRRGAVVITTYGIVAARPAMFTPLVKDNKGQPFKWDYVVLDEGHKIKNSSTKICKSVHQVPSRRRLVLTGTPVQNNLKELHTVVDWATFGGLLGPYKDFKRSFSCPIENGQDKNASEYVVSKSKTMAAELRRILAPHLLQRNKGEIWDEKAVTKTEMVVWVALSKEQREIYATYLGGESVKDVLAGRVSSPLEAISHLMKVCLHPIVSSFPLKEPWILDMDEPVENFIRGSPKLSVLLALVAEVCADGHRVLVFSRSVRMLDIIERCMETDESEGGAGFSRVCRIDGSCSDRERQQTIKTFNGSSDIPVCLISTGAGGTGITLTGADRVILFDPSWNPADDMQAVDRAYRIGQQRDVVVYRFIAAGTVEEKIYEKQVFKDGLRRTIMGGSARRKKNHRYFSRAELKQLFTLFPPGECRVLDQLDEMHGTLRDRLQAAQSQAQRALALHGGHLDFVCGLRGAYGASAHGDGLPKTTIASSTSSIPNTKNSARTNGSGDASGEEPAGINSEDEYESAAEEYAGDPLVPFADDSGLWLHSDKVDDSSEDDFSAGKERNRRRSGGARAARDRRFSVGKSRVLGLDDSDGEDSDVSVGGVGGSSNISPQKEMSELSNIHRSQGRHSLSGDEMESEDDDKDGGVRGGSGAANASSRDRVGVDASSALEIEDTDSDSSDRQDDFDSDNFCTNDAAAFETNVKTERSSTGTAVYSSPRRRYSLSDEDNDLMFDISHDHDADPSLVPTVPVADLASSPGAVEEGGSNIDSVENDSELCEGDGHVDTPPRSRESPTAANPPDESDDQARGAENSTITRWDGCESSDDGSQKSVTIFHDSSVSGSPSSVHALPKDVKGQEDQLDWDDTGDEATRRLTVLSRPAPKTVAVDERGDGDPSEDDHKPLALPTLALQRCEEGGRESARHWAHDKLGLSPAASSTSSASPILPRDPNDGLDEESDNTAAVREAEEVATASERATRFAIKELGMNVDELEDNHSMSTGGGAEQSYVYPEEEGMDWQANGEEIVSMAIKGPPKVSGESNDNIELETTASRRYVNLTAQMSPEERNPGGLVRKNSDGYDCNGEAHNRNAVDDNADRNHTVVNRSSNRPPPSTRTPPSRTVSCLLPTGDQDSGFFSAQGGENDGPPHGRYSPADFSDPCATRVPMSMNPESAHIEQRVRSSSPDRLESMAVLEGAECEEGDGDGDDDDDDVQSLPSPEARRPLVRGSFFLSFHEGSPLPHLSSSPGMNTPEDDDGDGASGGGAADRGESTPENLYAERSALSSSQLRQGCGSGSTVDHSDGVRPSCDRLSMESFKTARGSAVVCLFDDLLDKCTPADDCHHNSNGPITNNDDTHSGCVSLLEERNLEPNRGVIGRHTEGERAEEIVLEAKGMRPVSGDNCDYERHYDSETGGSKEARESVKNVDGPNTVPGVVAPADDNDRGKVNSAKDGATLAAGEDTTIRSEEGSSSWPSSAPSVTTSTCPPVCSPAPPSTAGSNIDISNHGVPAKSTTTTATDDLVSTVCDEHNALAAQFGFTCTRCRCFAGAEAAERAKILVERAKEMQVAGRSVAAMAVFLNAVELCDDDKELHRSIKRLAERIWGGVMA